MQTIYLDISNKGVIPAVYAKQGDIGRKIEIVFTNSGLPYVPPDGSVFSVWYSGESGEGNYTDIGDNSAFSINGNKVTVELITQMLTNDGNGILCIVLNESNGNQIGSWNIPYLCEKVPGIESEAAKEYYTAFSKSVEGLKQITENLTPEAIGAHPDTWLPTIEEIGAAPAGYGLGTNAKLIATRAEIDGCGFYRIDPTASDAPDTETWWGHVTHHNGNYYVFTASKYNGCTAQSVKTNSGWQPWELVNPPMIAGIEYRTTERWNGKAVYTKLLKLGATVNGEYVYFNIHGIDEMLKAFARIGENPIPYNDGNSYCNIAVAAGACIISCSTDFVGRNVTAQLFYTKK